MWTETGVSFLEGASWEEGEEEQQAWEARFPWWEPEADSGEAPGSPMVSVSGLPLLP